MGTGDLSELLEDARVLGRALPGPSEVGERFLISALGDEPSRGFFNEGEKEDHETGWGWRGNGKSCQVGRDTKRTKDEGTKKLTNLETDGDSPRCGRVLKAGDGDTV